MSKKSVASARRIVRYPEVLAHVTSCPTCKVAGGEDLIYEGRGGCATGRELDHRHTDAYCDLCERARTQVKRLVKHAMETLGVGARSIIESIQEALDEVLDETGDPEYARVENEAWLRRQLDSLDGGIHE